MRLLDKKKYSVEIQGDMCLWSFTVRATESDVQAWRRDGLRVFLVLATVPKWVVDIGFGKPYLLVVRAFRWTLNTLLGKPND